MMNTNFITDITDSAPGSLTGCSKKAQKVDRTALQGEYEMIVNYVRVNPFWVPLILYYFYFCSFFLCIKT